MSKIYKPGDKVYYTSPSGKKENGVVKEVRDSAAFVVYNCNGEWSNYKSYTGQHTQYADLTPGWVDERGNLMKQFCDHRYTPTNSKWASITQVKCQFCGDVID